MAKTSFAKEMNRHQLSWALANGVTPDVLEIRKGRVSRQSPALICAKYRRVRQGTARHAGQILLAGPANRAFIG